MHSPALILEVWSTTTWGLCVSVSFWVIQKQIQVCQSQGYTVRTKFQQITSKNPGYTTFFPNLLEGYGKRTQERRRRLRAGSPSLHHFCTLTWMKTLGDCQAEILRTKKGICVACEPDAQSKGPFRYPKHPRPKIHSENLNH